jgi:tubulin polyglutamylase TTLL1
MLCHFFLSVFYFLRSVRWNKIPSAENLGNFELLIDEELAAQTQDDNLLGNLTTGKQRINNRWK